MTNIKENEKYSEKLINSIESLLDLINERIDDIDDWVIETILYNFSLEYFDFFEEDKKEQLTDELYDLDSEKRKIIDKITKELFIFIKTKEKEEIKKLLFFFDLIKNEIHDALENEKRMQIIIKWELLLNEKKSNNFVRWVEVDKKYLEEYEWEALKVQMLEYFHNNFDAFCSLLRWAIFS